jgi:peptide/nickel transport system substrate-binding protein
VSYIESPRPDPNDSPMLDHVKWQYATGRMDRSNFVRFSALLGMSVSAAGAFVAGVEGPAAFAATRTRMAPALKRGGTLRVANALTAQDHPHRLSWGNTANVWRQSNEYLTFTATNGVTYPYLLDSIKPNHDATVWTLKLRKGIQFIDPIKNTPTRELNIDDVIWNFHSWLDPNVGSSVAGILGPFLDASGVQKVDKSTVRLHLKAATIAIPEFLYHYPAQILPANWVAPDLKKGEQMAGRLIGTGPFILKAWQPGQGARVVKNPHYWMKRGVNVPFIQYLDGNPLPYLDGIVWSDLGSDPSPYQAALQGGQADVRDQPSADDYVFFKGKSGFKTTRVRTITTELYRMRVDQAPWTDKSVRNAFKLLQPRTAIGNLGWYGAVDLGFDAHFGPADVDFVPKPIPKQDAQKAKAMLAASSGWQAWGNKPVTAVIQGGARIENIMGEIIKNAAKSIGVTVNLDVRPPSEYWAEWNNWNFGVTGWLHRPLNTMVNLLAYTREALPTAAAPGGWNETRWVNDQFLKLLSQANATPDLSERKGLVSKMEDIQKDDGGIGAPIFQNAFTTQRNYVQNLPAHPQNWLLTWTTFLSK